MNKPAWEEEIRTAAVSARRLVDDLEHHVPLSVRTGGRRKRLSWWMKGARERLAFRLAPWLRHGR